ncbi:MAG: TadE/TadG family type IV pilus assembly protein [Gemmatimonadota bacterium]
MARARGSSEGGTTPIELAMALPVLLLLMFGIFDFSRMVYARHRLRGYFNNPHAWPMNSVAQPASGCANAGSCFGMNEAQVRARSRNDALAMARTIRQDGIYIYSIGLGNLNNPNPLLTPDMAFLRQIANEGGIVSGSEPQGQVYFAPSAAELDEVFQSVAENILVRLAE